MDLAMQAASYVAKNIFPIWPPYKLTLRLLLCNLAAAAQAYLRIALLTVKFGCCFV